MAEGIEVWDPTSMSAATSDEFKPQITEDERDLRFERWGQALERSLNWNGGGGNNSHGGSSSKGGTGGGIHAAMSSYSYRLHSSVPCAVFVFTAVALCKVAEWQQTTVV